VAVKGYEFVLGATFNYPEKNCVACGKGKAAKAAADKAAADKAAKAAADKAAAEKAAADKARKACPVGQLRATEGAQCTTPAAPKAVINTCPKGFGKTSCVTEHCQFEFGRMVYWAGQPIRRFKDLWKHCCRLRIGTSKYCPK
jgi:hypothetical protein